MLLDMIERKKYYPLGSDKEVDCDCQIIASSSRDLQELVRVGSFRADLLTQISHWVYRLPGLVERKEDVEPNIDFELRAFVQNHVQNATFNKQAKEKYLRFCQSKNAIWSNGFRDLSASVNRMAISAEGGRIRVGEVDAEISRLKLAWSGQSEKINRDGLDLFLTKDEINSLDLFDRMQLAAVLDVCRSENL